MAQVVEEDEVNVEIDDDFAKLKCICIKAE